MIVSAPMTPTCLAGTRFMVSTLDEVWLDAQVRFDIVAASVAAKVGVKRPTPRLTLDRTPLAEVIARVRRIGPDHVQIQFGDGFVKSLLNLIDGLSDQQLSRLLSPDDSAIAGANELEDTRIVLYSVAEQFLMHHELFHLLCGHLDQRADELGDAGRALDELELAAFSKSQPPKPKASVKADLPYFVELEADASAIQFLADRTAMGDLARIVVDAETRPISDLEGPERAKAFRLCIASAWLVMLLFEGLRDGDEASLSHPWPGARIMGLLLALAPFYASVTDITEDPNGDRFTTLTDRTAESMVDYLMNAVNPAMKFAVSLVDGDRVVGEYRDPTSKRSDLFVDTLRDLSALIFSKEVATPSGRQLDRLMRRRAQFLRLMRPYRYFDLEVEQRPGAT